MKNPHYPKRHPDAYPPERVTPLSHRAMNRPPAPGFDLDVQTARVLRRTFGPRWIRQLPTARQVLAHLIIPWLLVLFATLCGTAFSAVVMVAVFGHRGGWWALAVGVVAGSALAWIAAATGWPVWLDVLRREELVGKLRGKR